MASISRDPSGNTTIQFVGNDGRRRSIRVGKMTQPAADTFKGKVEALVAAKAANLAIDGDTARWLAGLGDELHSRFHGVGLVSQRASANSGLQAFLDAYVAGRCDVKPGTLRHLKACAAKVAEFFGPGKLITEIKPGDADEFCSWIRGHRAQATASRMIKRAKQFFGAAVRKEIIAKNPFAGCKAGHQSNPARAFFIAPEMARQVLDACPDAEWRLLFALSRYGGLRCPSEHVGLTWADVDWERSRFRVRSPKTAHHQDGGERWVPIFPELRPCLEEAFELAAPGAVHVITRHRDTNKNLRTQLHRIIRRAALRPWPRTFHNLRATRQTELAAVFPLHVVCAWLGNKRAVAAEHYFQVTETDFERAAISGARALQIPGQLGTAGIRTGSQQSPEAQLNYGVVRSDATPFTGLPGITLTPTGFEPVSRP
jgi:integrase